MTCRSLEPQSQTQEKLLRGEPLKDAAAMKEFVSLVTAADGGGLAAVLLKCRDGGTMTALQEYRSELAGDARRAELERLDRLRKLLELPGNPRTRESP